MNEIIEKDVICFVFRWCEVSSCWDLLVYWYVFVVSKVVGKCGLLLVSFVFIVICGWFLLVKSV